MVGIALFFFVFFAGGSCGSLGIRIVYFREGIVFVGCSSREVKE